ncbi:MAG: YggS family pyridoxal phosphate-dependent enzyme [Deltaproteobacteria bacterium]|nr:YggS family pyridoxal phosphate-dependent enzyme [Deltaproteobacteria bacterium]
MARAAAAVLGALRAAEARAGRPAGCVRLVAVTKTVSAEHVADAWRAGLHTFGESYVQEALGKIDRLPPEAEWHFIGHLQSNKARQAVEVFSMIQSVDRASLADALEREASRRGIRVDVLLQVKVGDEVTKSGASFDGAVALVRRAPEWPSLRIRGLMAIPPFTEDPEQARPHFRAVRVLRDRIAALGLPEVEMGELSLGMSADYEVAVEEGATLVRVGSALFGDRPARDA